MSVGAGQRGHSGAEAPERVEVLMAGIGGRGVLFAGQLLAEAALAQYPHVAWYPSYATQVRGGPCECTTVFSDRPVGTPVLLQVQTVIVMVVSQLPRYLPRVAPGGLLLTEQEGLQGESLTRRDVRAHAVPALQTAMAAGGVQAANLVLLGAYLGLTRVLAPELVEAALERKGTRWGDTLARNREAFHRGLDLGARLAGAAAR